MKHLMKLENYITKPKSYWLIPLDDRGPDALKKLKCNRLDLLYKFNTKYIYINYTNNPHWIWGYMPYEKESEIWYENNNYTYKGAINIPEYELLANKFNI